MCTSDSNIGGDRSASWEGLAQLGHPSQTLLSMISDDLGRCVSTNKEEDVGDVDCIQCSPPGAPRTLRT